MDHELMTSWLSVDPMADKYPNISPYNYCMWNPIKLVDPDGNAVIPTSALKSNSSINAIMEYAGNNSVFKKVMRRFYSNQQTVYVHLGQLLKNGIPSGRQNLARTQSANSKENPVAKYGMPRIIINSDILNKSEELSGDWTFVFCALLHEGLHAKMYDIRREDRFFEEYPGYKDFIDDRPEDGGHHNLMAVYNRQLLVEGMKEFDVQTRVSHSEEWYEAISWYGLIDTIAWRYFESTNPEKAMRYRIIQSQEIRKLGRE